MSNPQQKKFQPISFAVKSFARINKDYKADVNYPEEVQNIIAEMEKDVDADGGIVVIFPPGYHYQESEGDQGTGKSSWQKALLEATGNILVPNAINSIDQTKAFNFKTWGQDGYQYHIRGTKSDYVIERLETNPETGEPILNAKGKPIKSEMKSPKTFIRQIVGPAGISPMFLAEMKPDEQIAWLRGLYAVDQSVIQQEVKLTNEYNSAYASRTAAGNKHATYKSLTISSPYYKDQPTHEKYFKETSFETLEQEFADIRTKYEEYRKNESAAANAREVSAQQYSRAIETTVAEIAGIEEQIAALQEKLALKKLEHEQKVKALEDFSTRLKKTEDWLEENKSIKEKYDNLNTRLVEATEFKANKQQWETMLENQKQMNHYENEYQRLTGLINGIKEAKSKLTEMFSPQIEGFKVYIPDEEEKRHGLYYKDHPLIELSESELWEMATQLWEKLNVQMVFVENISGLGSGAIEKFNQFIERGGFVFATKMNRAEKNLKISFSTKIA